MQPFFFLPTLPINYRKLFRKESHLTNGVVSKIADKVDTMKNMMTQHWQKAPNFVHGIRELSKYFYPLLLHVSNACLD